MDIYPGSIQPHACCRALMGLTASGPCRVCRAGFARRLPVYSFHQMLRTAPGTSRVSVESACVEKGMGTERLRERERERERERSCDVGEHLKPLGISFLHMRKSRQALGPGPIQYSYWPFFYCCSTTPRISRHPTDNAVTTTYCLLLTTYPRLPSIYSISLTLCTSAQQGSLLARWQRSPAALVSGPGFIP